MSWAVPDAACKHLTDTGYELEASMPLTWSSILFAGSWKSTSLLIEKTSKLPWKMQYATPLGDTCQPCWCPAVCGLVSISIDCESTRYSDTNMFTRTSSMITRTSSMDASWRVGVCPSALGKWGSSLWCMRLWLHPAARRLVNISCGHPA